MRSEAKGNHTGAVIGFATKKGEIVHARVASSFISPEQAELNLKELGRNSFDQLVANGREIWNREMSKIEIEDDNIDNLRTFYSCLYRSMLFPRSFYEIDAKGQVMHYSPYNGEVRPGYMFTDTGFWDTFRCLFPFLNLMYPSMNQKMQEGLVNTYKESGFLPEWASPGHRDCMVGNNSASVVADAYIKGLRGYDIETLWEALKHGANAHLRGTASGRLGYESYNQLGYVANNIGIGQNVARTLEYAYNDWAIYTLGKKLGKPESEIDIYKKHALNYKNVYHPERKLMVGKDNKGVFNPNFDAVDWSGEFCEGNSWHWSFCVFHDPQGLINLMGGKKEFNAMMDSVFVIPGKLGMESRGMIHEMREMQVMNMGQYAHGNQPIQHMVYLYNYSSEPWKAQYWIREIMNKLYTAGPDGYCGDEDNERKITNPQFLQTYKNMKLKNLLIVLIFNCQMSHRCPIKRQMGNGWGQRYPVIAKMVQYHDFDIFGTQECFIHQLKDMKEALPSYDYIGVGRDDGKEKGEHSAIFYRTDKFEVIEKGDFWLSETPDVPSKGWDAVLPRICSWGHFKCKDTGFEFLFFNLHMDMY